MQKVTPFLWFDGQAEQAAKFYVSIFKDAKILKIRRDGKVLGVTFRIHGLEFVAFNGGPHFKFTPAISLSVDCKSQAEIDELWEKLSKGGEKSRCGWLKDKYGLSWQIVPSQLGDWLADKDAAKSDRVWEALLKMDKIDTKFLKQAYNQK